MKGKLYAEKVYSTHGMFSDNDILNSKALNNLLNVSRNSNSYQVESTLSSKAFSGLTYFNKSSASSWDTNEIQEFITKLQQDKEKRHKKLEKLRQRELEKLQNKEKETEETQQQIEMKKKLKEKHFEEFNKKVTCISVIITA